MRARIALVVLVIAGAGLFAASMLAGDESGADTKTLVWCGGEWDVPEGMAVLPYGERGRATNRVQIYEMYSEDANADGIADSPTAGLIVSAENGAVVVEHGQPPERVRQVAQSFRHKPPQGWPHTDDTAGTTIDEHVGITYRRISPDAGLSETYGGSMVGLTSCRSIATYHIKSGWYTDIHPSEQQAFDRWMAEVQP